MDGGSILIDWFMYVLPENKSHIPNLIISSFPLIYRKFLKFHRKTPALNVGGQQIHQKRLHTRCFPVNSENCFRAVILWKTYQWEHFTVILSKRFLTYARVNFCYIISIQQALKRNEL